MANYLSDRTGTNIDEQLTKADTLLTPATGEVLLHSGNTGTVIYSASTPAPGDEVIIFDTAVSKVKLATAGVLAQSLHIFYNDNGVTGSIQSVGTSTSYNTSSDPRLKEFLPAPSDADINAKFDSLFSCFKTFNWKSDPDSGVVWGFDAHACIDNNTGLGVEGEGPRNLPIGAVYNTVDATYKSVASIDDNGDFTGETEQVEVTPEVEDKVSPAGVDQSKAVPILLAKIEQLERRLKAAGI